MFAAVLRRSLLPLLALASLAACSVVNKDHCANLEGDATCRDRDASLPYCSLCLPDNNGCFADRPLDACHAVTVPSLTTSGDTSTIASSSETTTTTTAIDPPTTGSGTDGASATSDTSSSTGDTTLDPSSGTTTGTTTTDILATDTDTSTGTTGTTGDTDTTAGTTMIGPFCGDGMIEDDEVCDGKNLGGETCKQILPNKWGGGTLVCNPGCKSFNDTKCCVGVGQTCGGLLVPDPDLPCCPDLTCKPEGGKHVCKAS